MKLVITGATGFVGREVVRQSLARPEITSVVALARSPVSIPAPETLPPGADTSKLRAVKIADYAEYSEDVRRETVAITPAKSRGYDWEVVKRVCHTSTLAGLAALCEAGPAQPFRFLYASGSAAERDQTKKPRFMPQYSLLRGETENQVLAYAAAHDGVEACAAKPGLILAGGGALRAALGSLVYWVSGMRPIAVTDLARVMLDQVIHGFEREPLMDGDLVRLAAEKGE
ncbi:hypothetical protein DL766_000106 [Monosporascus sp. MC13-8B]|uniref:NAD-dependent epimerase/dehydratase domain-containing protein n=1 Tax=Monosporascus cannonballus TaxID=155416 RepID=A0ABY0H8G2_9PEZI|nr:hypothetical protein DL762_005271 [Monosporascus cannonballus]RYO90428.1 hypothetical protein DL763_005348 [Monosporascus cannonballus]RYP40082.1 hypothetical protein DL766_000106 [Monosporascus sp. MC13-8B]